MSKHSSQSYSRLELWLISPEGKRTLNRFYSWGAAFVILGALFKFLGWPYANVILFFSMMTEVLVFFISGFEPQEDEALLAEPSESLRSQDAQPQASKHLAEGSESYQREMEELSKSVAELKREHERMTQNLAELNRVYRDMLEAMSRPTERHD